MRPIDADVLQKEAMTFNLGNEDYPCMGKLIYESDIEEAPTLDVAPVVHACWNDGQGYSVEILRDWYLQSTYVCSSCKTEGDKKTNYCPHCGAKMDGENDESN